MEVLGGGSGVGVLGWKSRGESLKVKFWVGSLGQKSWRWGLGLGVLGWGSWGGGPGSGGPGFILDIELFW